MALVLTTMLQNENVKQKVFSRIYSTILQSSTPEGGQLFKIAGKKSKDENNLQSRGIMTSTINFIHDCGTEKGRSCHRTVEPVPCTMSKQPKWSRPCNKICLPCCRPIDADPECGRAKVWMNMCKTIDFKYPSFAETTKCIHALPKCECCYHIPCTILFGIEAIDRKVVLKNNQRLKLGLPPGSKKYYSTDAAKCDPGAKKTEEKNKGLPCLKKVPVVGQRSPTDGIKNADCKKVCMPCCKPARDPPLCFFPYVKEKCIKYKPPRPSYSECNSQKALPLEPCECPLPVLKRCAQTDAEKNNKCIKQ